MISSRSCTSRSKPGKMVGICRLEIPLWLTLEERSKMMTAPPAPTRDRYGHLRTYAAAQKRATVDRLKQAIAQLEEEGPPVTTFTIREVSGLDYMAYYRNPEALALFPRHSTHLRKKRAKAQAKCRTSKRIGSLNDPFLYA